MNTFNGMVFKKAQPVPFKVAFLQKGDMGVFYPQRKKSSTAMKDFVIQLLGNLTVSDIQVDVFFVDVSYGVIRVPFQLA